VTEKEIMKFVIERSNDPIIKNPVLREAMNKDLGPRNMAQGGRIGFKGGSDAKTGMGFQKGNTMGQGRDLKGKPSLNVQGKNQYIPRTTKEIQAIIDANPEYITPKNFYEPTDKMKQKGSKKLLTLTDTQNPDVIFQKKGKDPADPEKQTARNTKRNESRTRQEGRKYKVTPPKGYQVHHMLPLAGNVDINTGDLAVISKKMNAKMSKYDKIINKLTTEASLLDFSKKNSLKRLDDLNEQLNGVLKTIKKDLPKEYKGLIGFNKLTPVFDEYGTVFRLTPEPVGIDYKKSIAGSKGVPIRDVKTSDIQDLVNKAPKFEMTKLAAIGCPGKAMGGRIGFSEGQNLVACVTRGVEKLKGDQSKLSPGDRANLRALTKSGKALKFLKGVLGPGAILGELVLEGGIAANKTLNEGVPFKTAFADSIFNMALGPKLKIDKEAELKKEFAKGEDYAMAERGRRMMIPQSATADKQRLKKRYEEMDEAVPTYSSQQIDKMLIDSNITREEMGMDDNQINKYIKNQRVADAGGVSNLAQGGLADLMKKYYD